MCCFQPQHRGLGFLVMAQWRTHVDAALDSQSSGHDRAAAQDALLLLLQQRNISINDIVLHLGSCLTSTDFLVRSKGMTFLGEMVARLHSTRLEEHVVHSLALFFTARIEDSACLHGALLGCNSLYKRAKDVGEVAAQDAVQVIKTVKWLDMQSLAQQDRLLCFELLVTLVERHPSEVGTLGTDLVTGAAQLIEGEKDPRCLLLAFRLIERLGSLFPDPKGPLAQAAPDLFDIIACYFPISFKLRPNDSKDISREDLIASLKSAFAASSFFASECIPLLLEKLSSSVQDSKLQSLEFLGDCAVAYGERVMDEYARPIWVALKAELFPHLTSFYSESGKLQDPEVFRAATICLTQCVKASLRHSDHDGGQFLRLILDDEICSHLLQYLTRKATIADAQEKHHMQTVGQVLSAAARASPLSSNIISATILPAFLSNKTCSDAHVLGVVVSVLTAIREVAVEQVSLLCDIQWLDRVFSSLTKLLLIFSDNLKSASMNEAITAICVSGLQCVATFPGYLSSLSEAQVYEFVSHLLELVLDKGKHANSWDQAVQAVASICATEDQLSASTGSASVRIVQGLVQAAFLEESDAKSLMAAITRISRSSCSARDLFFSELQRHLLPLNNESVAAKHHLLIPLFSGEFLALYENDIERGHAPALQFSMQLWSSFQSLPLDIDIPEEILIPWMDLVRTAVSMCDLSGQEAVVLKSYDILCSRCSKDHDTMDGKQAWLIAIWSSTAVAMRPNIQLLQDEKIIQLLLKTSLEVQSSAVSEYIAQALASILNKWPTTSYPLDGVVQNVLDELRAFGTDTPRLVSILAWIAKALAMRGDNKVALVAGILIEILRQGKGALYADGDGEDSMIRRAAAKALGVIVGDAKALNKRHFATVQPLYTQRFFHSFLPPLLHALRDAPDNVSRVWLIRGFSHLIVNVPTTAVLMEGNKVFPLLLEALSNAEDSDTLLGNLLILSAFLMDEKSKGAVIDRIGLVITCLVELVQYQHSTAVRETALQCLGAIVSLPFASIYPSSRKVLKTLHRALDDPKRSVRNEAARCYQAWWIK
ncbi:MMS19 nucleotide excision repair protein homolog [Selaginella moellendorffii]|uniref:MMS19 nucleotide excision repair protein homolog n=1 Tax=Selaginella moellendorffii TaxID=88036 RepID=UPI000D1CC84F|nr:MMS19 nucleotide excision repair protein homolog [Selaginella moellendorffii]|eukprot:XP_024531999.1 MMS19 nucleotide excision repair protein homolog [Selaginella moellendorffii]